MKEKNKQEKPTEEQLKKVKEKPSPEKKPKFPYPLEEESPLTESSKKSSPPGSEEKETDSLYLEEICGNLWFVLYQLGGILKKGFEPLTEDVKKLLSPPTARMAVHYHVERYMKDELLILGILGIDISKRLMAKKKDDKNDNREKGEGKDNPHSQPDIN